MYSTLLSRSEILPYWCTDLDTTTRKEEDGERKEKKKRKKRVGWRVGWKGRSKQTV